VNTGPATGEHWLDDLDEGGGRLLGEGCHFIDFACWLVGEWPDRVGCVAARVGGPIAAAKTFTVTLAFPGGSQATILYGAEGASGVSKEYIEAHSGGRSAILDDFRSLTLVEGRRRRKVRAKSQDKGHRAQFDLLRDALAKGGTSGDLGDPLRSMQVTFETQQAALADPGP
jgi:predicted dehydrogenase